MKTVLINLQALMYAPVIEDIVDHEVATMYKDRFAEFVCTARQWTYEYAIPAIPDNPAVSRMMEMGFDQDSVHRALEESNFDEALAIEKLLRVV